MTILRKALVGRSGVANKKFARGRAMIRRSAQFSANCAAAGKNENVAVESRQGRPRA